MGTSTTTVFVPGRGVVLEEPSLVALTTEDGRPVAVGSEARRVLARTSLGLGGMDFDEAIVDWVKKEHGLALGERTAEELKVVAGSAGPARPEAARAGRDDAPDEFDAEIRGRDLVTGLPRTIMT